MATTSSIFTGSSAYSTDFQNLIDRAQSIASLPIKQLESDKTALSDQATALSGLDTKFEAVQTAIDSLSKALSGSSYQADVSDDSKLTASLSDGAVEGSYKVDVVDAGAYATSMTAGSWIAPSGAARPYRLSLGDATYAFTPADNSAASVASAINSKYGDLVRATVVNVGGAQPDYRISLQAVALGDRKPALLTGPEAPTSLQTQQTCGSDTRAASRTAQSWNGDPGLTFQLSLRGQLYSLTPADNTAQGVADAINAAYADKVTATVADVGADGAPDYRIELVAAGPGDARPDILAGDGVSGPTSVQTQTATGSDTVAVSQSAASFNTDAGPTLKYQLSFGGVAYNLSPSDNSASAIVSDINAKYGDKVTAGVVDLGSASAHDYRITLTARAPGDWKPDVLVSGVDLQQQQTTGSLAHYIVNDSGKDVSSSTRSITIATGINVSLLAKDSGTPVTITIVRPTSGISEALSQFTDAYNNVVDELDKQRAADGALSGQSLARTLSQTLSGLTAYAGTGGLSLADLGVELDKTGHLTFQSFTLIAADLSDSSAVTAFLGSTTSGFLKTANDALTQIRDENSGFLSQARTATDDQIEALAGTIEEKQARVDEQIERLREQMAAADSLIASMQQQYSYMSSMIAAMKSASEQYQ
jgi:flagellar hook-associated protein 2